MTGRAPIAALMVFATWMSPAMRHSDATVTEYVSVVGADNAPLKDLNEHDFEVDSDGVPMRPITVAMQPAPLALVILIDASFSMPPTFDRNGLAKALDAQVLSRIRPGDRLRVGSIASTLLVGSRFTDNRLELRTALTEAIVGNDDHLLKPLSSTPPTGWPPGATFESLLTGPSAIWDALWTARGLLDAERDHRAILLVTDGKASGNVHGFNDTLHWLFLGGITVSVVGEAARQTISQVGGRAVSVQPTQQLEHLARETGGLYAVDRRVPADARPLRGQPPTAAAMRLPIQDILERMIVGLQQSYAISFPSAGDGTFHNLQIKSRRPDVVVRARTLYLAK